MYNEIAGFLHAMETCTDEWYKTHEKYIDACMDKLSITPVSSARLADDFDTWRIPLSAVITASLIYGYDVRINWHGYGGKFKEAYEELLYEHFYQF